ncbi:uncharacterized protein LOC108673967, partial [Hyalella azteca]|uniref:Uncharacterized protein LOC108673967 n=1 Tax=Hyalella azteca TaxID=294128 RepID=A0A8B7NUD5_HYAAZ
LNVKTLKQPLAVALLVSMLAVCAGAASVSPQFPRSSLHRGNPGSVQHVKHANSEEEQAGNVPAAISGSLQIDQAGNRQHGHGGNMNLGHIGNLHEGYAGNLHIGQVVNHHEGYVENLHKRHALNLHEGNLQEGHVGNLHEGNLQEGHVGNLHEGNLQEGHVGNLLEGFAGNHPSDKPETQTNKFPDHFNEVAEGETEYHHPNLLRVTGNENKTSDGQSSKESFLGEKSDFERRHYDSAKIHQGKKKSGAEDGSTGGDGQKQIPDLQEDGGPAAGKIVVSRTEGKLARENDADIVATKRNKRSYGDSYLQSIGYDPMMAWGAKRYDDQFMQTLDDGPSMTWNNKQFDDQDIGGNGYYLDVHSGQQLGSSVDDNSSPVFENFINREKRNNQAVTGSEETFNEDVVVPGMFVKNLNLEPIITKRSLRPRMFIGVDDYKRSPSEMGPRGFHEGIFNDHFGYFSPVKRNKRSVGEQLPSVIKTESKSESLFNGLKDIPTKRKFGMDAQGFYSDTFSGGFGDFGTMKKRYNDMTSSGFYGDTFSGGFGDFGTMKKRYSDMTSSGFHGDTFSGGFGDFGTMKKRYLGMTSHGFHGDTFSGGFGDFGTMKKRYLGMTSHGFHGDTFSGGFGDFGTMKKRFPALTPDEHRRAYFNNRLAALFNNSEMSQGSRKNSQNRNILTPGSQIVRSDKPNLTDGEQLQR